MTMKKRDVYELAKLLIGPVIPVGDCGTDEQRLANLIVQAELVNALLDDIAFVADMQNSGEASIVSASREANKALNNWRDWLNERSE